MRALKMFRSLLPLLLVATLMGGTVQGALLDLGPIVPPVIGSTPPNLGHGFPLWYRDTNRVPLQLCVEEVPGCLPFVKPNPNQPMRYPDNMPDEIMYWSAQVGPKGSVSADSPEVSPAGHVAESTLQPPW